MVRRAIVCLRYVTIGKKTSGVCRRNDPVQAVSRAVGANRDGTGEVMGVNQGSGVRVLEDPLTNKGTAFSEEERSGLGLHGLLPSVVETLDQQTRRRYEAY